MIVPLQFVIQREDVSEETITTRDGHAVDLLNQRLRLTIKIFDTATGRVGGYSGVVMFDQSAEPGREMGTLFAREIDKLGFPGWAPDMISTKYLRELRDEIDKVLS